MAAVGLISAAHATPPPFYKYKGDAAGGHFEYIWQMNGRYTMDQGSGWRVEI